MECRGLLVHGYMQITARSVESIPSRHCSPPIQRIDEGQKGLLPFVTLGHTRAKAR
eukprot:COSAG02_NODE_168_length_31711_cov_68.337973_12_plen_56_part_00